MKTFTKTLKVSIAVLMCFITGTSFSQVNMTNGSSTTCSSTLFDSGGSGGNYTNSENFTYTYCPATAGDVIQAVFTSFLTESGFDNLAIYDGPNTGFPQIGNYTGATSPGTVAATLANGGCLTFVFTSDGSVTSAGWEALISCITPGGGGGGGPINMTNGSDVTCSGTLFDSGGSGGNYANSENFTYTYCPATAGDVMQAVFTSFLTESGFDNLTIYDGPNSGFPQIGNYTGATSPGTVSATLANGGCLTFVFTSDGSVTSAGWEALISCITPGGGGGGGPINMTNGSSVTCSSTFYDSGGSGAAYNNSENFTYTYCPATAGDVIQAVFANFLTESGFDQLTIYDGPNTGSPIIGTYSGATSPGTVEATLANGGCLTFVFTSDGSVNSTGWEAIISCVVPGSGGGGGGAPTNVTCDIPDPICSGSPIVFTAQANGTTAATANPGNNYDCLFTSPNPSWYYLEISGGGNLAIDITAGSDIDFELWGPFANLAAAVASCNSYGVPIDCSYSIAATEQANAAGALPGEVYVLLVTNYANTVQTITLNDAVASTATTNCNIVLPVELASFTAVEDKEGIQLNWTTLSENNNDYFVVERSIDGKVWSSIGIVDGAGTTSNIQDYNLVDRNAFIGSNYYRLKQFDTDGSVKVYDVINVQKDVNNDLILIPNPAEDIVLVASENEFSVVAITDISGTHVLTKTQNWMKQATIDVAGLKSGVYLVSIQTKYGISTDRLIIR
ncbi:MAG: hypothetical protein ACJASQ_000425 [Crocinitomicaceae bacterium]|jgi:hypothetical protein